MTKDEARDYLEEKALMADSIATALRLAKLNPGRAAMTLGGYLLPTVGGLVILTNGMQEALSVLSGLDVPTAKRDDDDDVCILRINPDDTEDSKGG